MTVKSTNNTVGTPLDTVIIPDNTFRTITSNFPKIYCYIISLFVFQKPVFQMVHSPKSCFVYVNTFKAYHSLHMTKLTKELGCVFNTVSHIVATSRILFSAFPASLIYTQLQFMPFLLPKI